MKKFLVVSMLIISSALTAQEAQTYGQCPDFGGANGNNAELVCATGLPITPKVVGALAKIAQYYATQKTEQ